MSTARAPPRPLTFHALSATWQLSIFSAALVANLCHAPPPLPLPTPQLPVLWRQMGALPTLVNNSCTAIIKCFTKNWGEACLEVLMEMQCRLGAGGLRWSRVPTSHWGG